MSWCWLLGHVYRLELELSLVCRVIKCSKCEKRWLMNDSYQASVPLDDDAKKFIRQRYRVQL